MDWEWSETRQLDVSLLIRNNETLALHRCLWSLFEGSHQSRDHMLSYNWVPCRSRKLHEELTSCWCTCYNLVVRVSLPFLLGVYNGADGSYTISRHSPSTCLPLFQPDTVLANFELRLRSAMEMWRSVTVRGCYFHFKLTHEYQVIESDIRKSFLQIAALPFAPQ